jgi:hypothetical protein
VTRVTLREGGQGDFGKTGTKAGVQLLSNLSFAEFEFAISNPATCSTPLSGPSPSPPAFTNVHYILLCATTHPLTGPLCPRPPPHSGTPVWVGFVAMLWEKEATSVKLEQTTPINNPPKGKCRRHLPPVHWGSSSASLAYLSNASRGYRRRKRKKIEHVSMSIKKSTTE